MSNITRIRARAKPGKERVPRSRSGLGVRHGTGREAVEGLSQAGQAQVTSPGEGL